VEVLKKLGVTATNSGGVGVRRTVRAKIWCESLKSLKCHRMYPKREREDRCALSRTRGHERAFRGGAAARQLGGNQEELIQSKRESRVQTEF